MVFKMLLLAFSVLLIVKATLGKIDCEIGPFKSCGRPKVFDEIPREVSEFNDVCVEAKSYIRCVKEWQDECGTDRIVLFRKPGLFEATYTTISDVCEEGTLLNTVAIENLKCVNETFGKTRCEGEAEELVEPLIKRIQDDEMNEYRLDIMCLEDTYSTDCVLRALSENCGKLVEEAMLQFIRRSKSQEYACSVEEAQSVLDEMDNLLLSEDKKKSMTLLLENLVESNSD